MGGSVGKNSRARHQAKRKAAHRRGSPGAGDPFGLFGAPTVPSALEIAGQIIERAVHALHGGHGGELDRCRAVLVAGTGGAAGIQVADRALLARLMDEVERAWRRGWQPAELVRVARRERTARHGRLMADGIAARLREYPKAVADQQLAVLDAEVWWDHDDLYVSSWGDRHGLDRATVITELIEVFHLLATLPAIEVVGPAPGDAGPVTAAGPADPDQRMLDRVRALLAKAESTDFPQEAEAFTAKAQELMARHRIDHALLVATTGERDRPATRRVAVDNPYEAPKSLLLQVVAEANRCRAVWTKRFAFTTLVGFPADLDATELLFTSLLVQATRAMTQATTATRSFRQSFLTAYASRIGERLIAATDEVGGKAADSDRFLPVLAARDDAVREVFEKQFPALTHQTTTISNRQGWVSGRAAADRASLHGRPEVRQQPGPA